MSVQPDISVLIFKKLQDTITPAELSVLEQWADNVPENRMLLNQLLKEEQLVSDVKSFDDLWQGTAGANRYKKMERTVLSQISVPVRSIWRRWIPYAAIVAGVAIGAGILMFNRQVQVKEELTAVKEIVSAENSVILTLGNGREINLSTEQDGIIISDNILYRDSSAVVDSTVPENGAYAKNDELKLTTPKGVTYQLTLADGSKVWLNSLSELKYPVRFREDERIVELEGEAYFEIAKSSKADGSRKPFKVITNNQTVEVLGTHFNIRSYNDESIVKTTLLEGSVRIYYQALAKMLKPGEQAAYSKPDNSVSVSEVNPDDVIAWKEGYFSFKDIGIVAFMNDLKRWYDIDVEYKGEIKSKKISGTFSRSKNIEELLLSVEDLGDYKFKTVPRDASGKGRRVVVMSN